MKKVSLAIALALVLVLSTIGVASAITNGQPDGNNHPYVGLVVLIDEDGVPLWRCSGSLISSSRFLLAGHCTAPDGPDIPAEAAIWFGAGPVTTDPDFLAGDGTC